jgi:hypothetical protein
MSDNRDPHESERKKINRLVEEIAHLGEQAMSPAEYFDAFLTRVLTAVAAPAGAAYMFQSDRSLRLVYCINYNLVGLSDVAARQTHSNLLRFALRTAKPLLAPPHSDDFMASNPTSYFILLAPIRIDGKVVGLIEVFQNADRALAAQHGFLQFIHKMADSASLHFQHVLESPEPNPAPVQRAGRVSLAMWDWVKAQWRKLFAWFPSSVWEPKR